MHENEIKREKDRQRLPTLNASSRRWKRISKLNLYTPAVGSASSLLLRITDILYVTLAPQFRIAKCFLTLILPGNFLSPTIQAFHFPTTATPDLVQPKVVYFSAQFSKKNMNFYIFYRFQSTSLSHHSRPNGVKW